MKFNHLLFLAALFLPLVSTAQSIKIEGSHGYTMTGWELDLRTDRIVNYGTSGTTSGTLRLALWATESRYTGGTISGWQIGYVDLGKLSGGFEFTNVDRGTIINSLPPNGEYYTTMTLSEWGGSAFFIIDYVNFATKWKKVPLELDGSLAYDLSETGLVRLTADRIVNPATSSNTSGDLRLELWALSSPFINEDSLKSGHIIGHGELNPLQGGWEYTDIVRNVSASIPPPGSYHLVMVLREFELNAYQYQDHVSFPTVREFLPQTNTIELQGSLGWSSDGDVITVDVDRIANQYARGSLPVELRLSLWATESPFSGGTVDGWRLGSETIGSLAGGLAWDDVVESFSLTEVPPLGEYNILLTLNEPSDNGYDIHDYHNFSTNLTVALLEFNGLVSYEHLSPSSIRLEADKVVNPRNSSNTSGSIKIELWAFPSSFSGSFDGGHLLASASLDPLEGGFHYFDVLKEVPFSRPPDGKYSISMILLENTFGSYTIQDYRNFNQPWTFETPLNQYTVNLSPGEGGITAVNPDSESYPEGSIVTISANPDRGFAFKGWEGDFSSLENPMEVEVDQNISIQAIFEETRRYTVNLVPGEGYTLSVDPEMDFYLPGETVTVSVDLEEGFEFDGWPPNNEKILEYTFPEESDTTEIFFVPPVQRERFDITLIETEFGQVWSTQSLTDLPQGSELELDARPTRGYEFVAWTGFSASTENPLSVVVTEAFTIGATFDPLPAYSVILGAGEGYTVSINPVFDQYYQGDEVEVSIVIEEGYDFSGWEGILFGEPETTTFTFPAIDEPAEVSFIATVGRSTGEPSLWSGFEQYGDWYSGWLGWITNVSEEYIFHVNLGSLYFSGDSEEAIWLYIFAGDIGWTWVGKANYPFMYHQDKGWIMHLEESDWFLDWDTEEWFQVTP